MKQLIIHNEERTYRVRWEQDIKALSAPHAARQAAQMHFNHQVMSGKQGAACTFDVLGYRCQQKGVWHEETSDRVNLTTLGADMSVDDLREVYGIAGHPVFDPTVWKSQVLNGTTWEGYWGWLATKLDAQAQAVEQEE